MSGAAAPPPPAPPAVGPGEPRGLLPYVHLAALASLALAQPLLGVIGEGPGFLVSHAVGFAELLAFVALVSLALPAALAALAAAPGLLGPRARRWSHTVALVLLLTPLALLVAKRVVPARWSIVFALALAAAGLGAALYRRSEAARSFCSALSLALVVVPLQFLLLTPASRLVFPPEVAAAEPASPPRTPHPVVLVVFDELSLASLLTSELEVDAARFPNIAAVASRSRWFRNATTVHFQTEAAVPALLTGRYPAAGPPAPATFSHHPRNLFTLLADSHEVHAFEAITALCPPELAASGARGVDVRALVTDLVVLAAHLFAPLDLERELPSVREAPKGFELPLAERFGDHLTEGRMVHVERFLATVARAGERPPLYVLHALLPHVPWTYLPSGQRYTWRGPRPWEPAERWPADEWAVSMCELRYLLQLGFVDRLVGRLVARLEEVGIYDDCLLVLAADHGLSFRPGDGRRIPSASNLPELASVPLFVKLPGQDAGVVDDRDVELVDVLPTIAGALGLDVPWRVDGRDAFSTSASTPRVRRLAGQPLPGDVRARLLAARAPFERRSGSGTPFERLFARGPFADVVGRRVRDLPRRSGARRLTLSADLSAARTRDPEAAWQPCYVGGQVTPAPPRPLDVALALGGRVVAVTRTEAGSGVLHALLPLTAVQTAGELEAFLLERDARGGAALIDLSSEVPSLRWADDAPIALHEGRAELPLRSGALLGFVEVARPSADGSHLRVRGWAADPRGAQPLRVLLFVGAKYAGESAPHLRRRDVAKHLGRKEAIAGFELVAPADAAAEALTVIAVGSGGAASVLPALPGADDEP